MLSLSPKPFWWIQLQRFRYLGPKSWSRLSKYYSFKKGQCYLPPEQLFQLAKWMHSQTHDPLKSAQALMPHGIQTTPSSDKRAAGWLVLLPAQNHLSVPTPATHHQVDELTLTKAELMASTKVSSSMLTSSAACSWDVDQTRELKVSVSCLKRTTPTLRAKILFVRTLGPKGIKGK